MVDVETLKRIWREYKRLTSKTIPKMLERLAGEIDFITEDIVWKALASERVPARPAANMSQAKNEEHRQEWLKFLEELRDDGKPVWRLADPKVEMAVRRNFAAPHGAVRMTVNLPGDLHRALKLMAFERGVTITAMVAEWVEGLIAAKREGGAGEAVDVQPTKRGLAGHVG